MTFEKALEAMKQGKKVNRKVWADMGYYLDDKFIKSFNKANKELDTIAFLSTETILSDDWEIYEESQEETEMTAEKALEIIKCLLDYGNDYFCYEYHFKKASVSQALELAKEALENQNQPEKWIEKSVDIQRIEEEFKDALACIRDQPQKIKIEKKCERKCNCEKATIDLQQKMKQVLSRKFFELAEETSDSYSVNNMLDIYRLLYEVKQEMKLKLENGEIIETDDPLKDLAEYTASRHNTDTYQLTRAILSHGMDFCFDFLDIPLELKFELLGLMADLRGIKGEEAGIAFNIICRKIYLDKMTEKDFKTTFLELLNRYYGYRIIKEIE